jgi:hypothetical protein
LILMILSCCHCLFFVLLVLVFVFVMISYDKEIKSIPAVFFKAIMFQLFWMIAVSFLGGNLEWLLSLKRQVCHLLNFVWLLYQIGLNKQNRQE